MNVAEYNTCIGRLRYGKRVNLSVYVHYGAGTEFEEPLGAFVSGLVRSTQVPREFSVIKFRPGESKISLLSYPSFFEEAHPSLSYAVAVDLATGKARHTDYKDNINPPILHRKEQMLPPDHPKRAEFLALTESEEAEGLFDNTATIGFRLNWERLLASKGLSIEGHELRRIDSEWQDSPVEVARPRVQRHRTALRRYELSKPVKCLLQQGLLSPGKSFFDYGCGLGTDMNGLQAIGYPVAGWDPNHRPNGEKAPAEVVNMGYVLNVIEDPAERLEALCGAWKLTKEVLVVAALIRRTVDEESARLLNDGVLTGWDTFQKYFDQSELQQYIEDALETTAIPLALGVFVVFRDPVAQQEFIARRTRRYIDWGSINGRLCLGTPAKRGSRKRAEEYEQNEKLLQQFWQAVLERGRIPIPQEFAYYPALVERLGSAKRALRVVLDTNGEEPFEQARTSRIHDLLVYLALANLRKPVPVKHLSPSLREDMEAFFDTYRDGLRRGRELLFAAGDPGEIDVACEGLQVGWQDEQALYFHHGLLDRLPPILRVYCGCAEAYCGDLGRIDLIKLHKASGKLTFLVYDDIQHQLLPELQLRIKVNLRTGFVQVFDHSADHQVLCLKERFFAPDNPRYPEWADFGKKLRASGVSDHGFIGPTRRELDAILASRTAVIGEEI